MGQAKIKSRSSFPVQLIEEWEADDCVNFAVALARLTGWLLHVDWWSTSTEYQEDTPVSQLKPLRAYVADNRDQIFDVRGVKHIVDFNLSIITRQVQRIQARGPGGVYTRFYGEEKLPTLPLRSQPEEAKIVHAITEIQKNKSFLADIPLRKGTCIPAHEAARFTYGLCAAYAEAMHELTDLQAVALLAKRFSPLFENTKRSETGYFHSVVLHSDGMAEDSWGIAPLEEIASRFGVVEFATSGDEHRLVVEKLKRSSAERYEVALANARALIQTHRSI